MYLLGFDIGSSSVKATLLDAANGEVLGSASSPQQELEIIALKPGWAEQDPETWWTHAKLALAAIAATGDVDLNQVAAIGISYQMHGLVLVDKQQQVLRPSIIWCDSRAVEIGDKAFAAIGEEKCLTHLLNSPGNFTASKLRWVQENEPDIYSKIDKMMMPGDYLAMRLTGEAKTTPSGLSEGILWDFQEKAPARMLLAHYGISPDLLAEVAPTFSVQGELTKQAAEELGLKTGTKVSYRAGDQPNNALSLNVLEPGEIAANAGTSGVVYGVGAQVQHDPGSRVNPFAHVNYTPDQPRYGVLMCLNGTGIMNSWLKHNATQIDYPKMNELAAAVPIGADGLSILPYGNGAERTLGNRDIGAQIVGLQLTRHDNSHLLRAAQEGIAFALNYGVGIMREMGIEVKKVRAGDANMFLSPLFGEAFANITGAQVELYNTDGSQGAARGAGIGAGIYSEASEAFAGLKTTRTIEPEAKKTTAYQEAYTRWTDILKRELT